MMDTIKVGVPAGGPLVRAQGITKIFKKDKAEIPVLRGVDLDIAAGETIAITGASGVGKSTLLHILGTLEPPTAGKVYFGGAKQDLFSYPEKELSGFRNRSLGFVFQFHYLLPEFTALENVMMPALIAGHMRRPAENQARELLQFVGLGHRLAHRPSELSGGEQQRVAIARAVILRPKLLLADELTGNLDSVNSGIVMDLLGKLNESTGIAVLLVTHDMGLAGRMQRTLVMKDGRIVS
ncbi:MAG: ABC transporter ATP-binding protein [Bdellovibrionales bacterium RIFOXYD1_FULL_53_11]|nr:MAG: ABC transporter ATP-binding protein [Bdellovibrionales bacterium RIFOXYD1_FULL_53_11]